MKCDLDWCAGDGKLKFSYPDIVWKTSEKFRHLADLPFRKNIVLHNLSRNEVEVFKLLNDLPLLSRRNYEIRIVHSEHCPEPSTLDHFYHQSVTGTLEMLSSSCAIFSNRLHLGLAAASLGASFVIVRPEPKVLSAVGESNINFPIVFSKRFLFKEIVSTLLFDNTQSIHIRQQVSLLASLANGHIDQFMRFLN